MLCFPCCCVKLITSTLTSYFCLFSFSPRSNFSASSCIIHCQSSLAFSLRQPIRSFVSGQRLRELWWDHVQRWLTSVYLQTDDRCWLASSYPPGSSSSSLSPSVSSPLCDPRPARHKWWRLIQRERGAESSCGVLFSHAYYLIPWSFWIKNPIWKFLFS